MKRALRRTLTTLLLVAGVALAFACVLYARADVDTVGEVDFINELAIPPLLEPSEADGRQLFDLTLQQGRREFLPGKPTETWGVNGGHLGPTLRAQRGDRVEVRVRNDLPETTTIHWHGMHLPAAADGGPHQPIEPGATWTASWNIDQPAATLWYHPHPHGDTADHVYRGVAGLFLLDDPDSDAVGRRLPNDYGVDDIPLIIQDKRLHEDGRLDFGQGLISPTGRLGSTILVNGTASPFVAVVHERVRLRLLNGSNARVYNLGFADDRDFDLIATDAGLLEAPARMNRLQLSPGERAELVAAFVPGERIVLRSYEPDLGTNVWETRFAGGDDSFDVLEIRAAASLAHAPEVPAALAKRAAPEIEDATRVRSFTLSGSRINGRKLDMSRIDHVSRAGTSEIWRVRNAAGIPHNFHVHGASFAILDHAGEKPPPHLSGLKDTVYVPPGATLTLLVRFPDDSGPTGRYMFHCHVLQHEDLGMMGQFVVAEDERRDGEIHPRRPVSANGRSAPETRISAKGVGSDEGRRS